jgi:hypothetical protein
MSIGERKDEVKVALGIRRAAGRKLLAVIGTL